METLQGVAVGVVIFILIGFGLGASYGACKLGSRVVQSIGLGSR